MTLTSLLTHTPAWVFAVFAILLVVGLRQTRPNRMRLVRVLGVALVMTALSLWGIAGLAHTPAGNAVWLAWALAWVGSALLVGGRLIHPAARYDAQRQSFALPGSWWPLALMMGIFGAKYLLGVATAMHAAWLQSPLAVLTLAGFLGAASGVFMARALGLLRLARATPLTVN